MKELEAEGAGHGETPALCPHRRGGAPAGSDVVLGAGGAGRQGCFMLVGSRSLEGGPGWSAAQPHSLPSSLPGGHGRNAARPSTNTWEKTPKLIITRPG